LKLHERIRMVRKAKGISQTRVAEQVGMTVSSYNMKELGKRPISTDELEGIAGALGENVSFFYEDNFHVKLNEGLA